MNPDLILAHTSFLGFTGYANHSREFFTELNKNIPVRVRNFSHVKDVSYLTDIQHDMIIKQRWSEPPFTVGREFDASKYNSILNIILNETNHYFFYDEYEGSKIAYNVWESTRQPDQFFKRLLEYDQLWVPTQWQKIVSAEQGYPMERIFVVPEAVDPEIFKPLQSNEVYKYPDGNFRFLLFGRWDYRKAIKEIIESFLDEFSPDEPVRLVLNVDNPFPVDGMHSTEERLRHYEWWADPRLEIVSFLPFEEYLRYLQLGNCLVSCSRAEGWNLPLIEAMACGIPTICSDYGAQLEFAKGISQMVKIKGHKKPENVFMNENVPGTWAEPDFQDLKAVMRYVYNTYDQRKIQAFLASDYIRRKFTWENSVTEALKAIDNLKIKEQFQVPEKVEGAIKLNLGCGNKIKTGYINVDYFNNSGAVDVVADVKKLPFKKESVDEILFEHTIEHMGKYGVPKVLSEFNRVMKRGARLKIVVPDLESCIEEWNNLNPIDKYRKIDYIFGGQSHGGDFHFNGFIEENLKMVLFNYGFKTMITRKQDSMFGSAKEIYNESAKVITPSSKNTTVRSHFVDGPFVEWNGDDTRDHDILFYDKDAESVVHRDFLPINMWTRPHRKWFTNWIVRVAVGDEVIYTHEFNAKGKNVLISFDSKSLGDTLAWIPYVETFRAKHGCRVFVSTFWNHILKGEYQGLDFINPGEVVQNLYASYTLGCRDGDLFFNKYDWRETQLQKIASDILGLEFKEIRPKVSKQNVEKIPGRKLVTLSEAATAGCKQWQYPGGWQRIVDFLKNSGYEVAVISKEPTDLKGIIDWTAKPIEQTITNISASDFFMGLSSGPAWLAWALGVHVVMISGCTKPWNEFQTGITRIYNSDVCNGCFNNSEYNFDRGDWWWCPTGKDFECTKTITPEMVITQIKNLIKE